MQICLYDLQGMSVGVGFGQWDTTERWNQKDLNISLGTAVKGQKADVKVKFFQSCIMETNIFILRKLFYTISL